MIPSFSEFIFENRDPEFVKQMDKEFDRLKDDDEFLYRGIRYKTIEKNDSVAYWSNLSCTSARSMACPHPPTFSNVCMCAASCACVGVVSTATA